MQRRHSCPPVHLRPPRFEHAEFAQLKAIVGTRLGTDRRDGGRSRREHGEGGQKQDISLGRGLFFFYRGCSTLKVIDQGGAQQRNQGYATPIILWTPEASPTLQKLGFQNDHKNEELITKREYKRRGSLGGLRRRGLLRSVMPALEAPAKEPRTQFGICHPSEACWLFYNYT